MVTAAQGSANDDEPAREAISLADLLANAFHDRIAIGAIFLAIFALAVAISLNLTRMYETEARLLVLPGQEYSSQSLSPDGAPLGNLVSDQISKAEIEVLSSNELRREVVKRLGAVILYPELAGRQPTVPGTTADDEAAQRLGDDLNIEPQQDSSVIRIRFRHRDPAIAASVVNELLQSYLGTRLTIFNRDRGAYLIARRDEAETVLAQARQKLVAFNGAHGLTALPAEVVLRLEQQSRLRLQALQARQAAAAAGARRDSLTRSLAALPAQILLATDSSREPENGNSRATLLSLQLRRQELLAKYADTSGYIQDVDQQIAALRSFEARNSARTSQSTNRGVNPAAEALRLDLDAAIAANAGETARAAALDIEERSTAARLDELGTLKPEQRRLVRRMEADQMRFRLLSRRYEDAVAAEAFERGRTGNVRVTQFASEGRPVSTGRLLIMGAGFVFGLLAAAGLGIIRALMRDTMLTPTEAAHRLGLPVLVALPDRVQPTV